MSRIILFLIFLSALTMPIAAQPSDARMRSVVSRVVKEYGAVVTGTGSWMSSNKFKDPLKGGTSDFDMTLRLREGLSDEEARRSWQGMRAKISQEIKKEFGPDADKILKKTNLYPPDQLMPSERIKDTKAAAAQYKALDAVPSLDPDIDRARQGGKLQLSDKQFADHAEGLYGEGGKRFRQEYDFKTGRTFVAMPGPSGQREVVQCLNPGPFSKSWQELSPDGRSSLITQFSHKSIELLDKGDQRAAVKNVQRLLEERSNFQKELDFDLGHDPFLAELDPTKPLSPADEKLLRKKILQLEMDNQFMLRQSKNKGLLKKLMDNKTLWAKVQRVVGATVDSLDKVGPAVQGLFLVLDAARVANAVERKDWERVMKSSYLMGLSTAAASPAFLAEMVDLTMEMSKELGYGLIDKNIDVLDFLSGVRRDDVVNEATIHDPRELLRRWPEEATFLAYVNSRTQQAWPADTAIDRDNRNRWTEKSLALYRSTRKSLEARFYELVALARDQEYLLLVPGAEIVSCYQAKVHTSAGAVDQVAELRGVRASLEEIRGGLQELASFYPARLAPQKPGAVPKLHYRWFLDGAKVADSDEPRFTFKGLLPGTHSLEAEVELGYLTVDPTMWVNERPVASRGLMVEGEKLALAVSVKDALSSDPIPGACVTVTGKTETTELYTTTDGTVKFSLSAAGSYAVSVRAKDYEKTQATLTLEDKLSTKVIKLTPEAGSAEIAVTVKNALSEKPVEGAKVTVSADNDSQSAVTAEDGLANIALNKVRGKQVNLQVSKKGYKTQKLVCALDKGRGSKVVLLETGPLLYVAVRDKATDKPLPGAKVEVVGAEGSRLTNNEGQAELDIGLADSVVISVSRKGYHPGRGTVPVKQGVARAALYLDPLLKATLSGPRKAESGTECTYQLSLTGGKQPFNLTWTIDGVRQDVSSEAMKVTWGNSGDRIVKVAVLDKEGLACETSLVVKVNAGKLAADLAGPTRVKVTDRSEHAVKIEGGVPPYRMEWYADGQRADVREDMVSVFMTWAKLTPGQHTLAVVVTDKNGTQARAQQTIELEIFKATASGPTQATQGEQSTFTVRATGGAEPYSCKWYLNGVEQNLNDQAITVTWANPGICKLGIVVFDATGAKVEIADTITVNPAGSPPLPTSQPSGSPAGGGGYAGRIQLGRKTRQHDTYHELTLSLNGSSFSGAFSKNEEPYYGIQCYGQFTGTVSEYFDSMSRTVMKDRMRLKGTLSGTCQSNNGKEVYPLQGEIYGTVFQDGTGVGAVDFVAPPFGGSVRGHYEWTVRKR